MCSKRPYNSPFTVQCFNDKTYPGGLYMTQVHFTLKSEEIQSIIEYSVKDDVSKNILTTVFNQLMENQRTENRQSQRNGYYERSFTTRVGTLELKVPRTRDGHFHPQCLNVINETKSPHGFNVGNVCIRRFNS